MVFASIEVAPPWPSTTSIALSGRGDTNDADAACATVQGRDNALPLELSRATGRRPGKLPPPKRDAS